MIPGPTHSKASSRSSAYHHKALAEIRNSLLPFAATPLPSDSASSASSVSSGYTPNGLEKDTTLYTSRLVQMGYSEELSAKALKQAGGRFDIALDILKQLDSPSLNGMNKVNSSPGNSMAGTKVKRKSSLEREVNIRASPAVDSGAGSSRSDSPRQGLVELMSHSVVGRGQYSPSSFLEVPPPPPPPRTSSTPPPPPPPHTYPSNVQQLLKRMSPCQPPSGASSSTSSHTRGTSPVSRQPMVVQNSPQVQQQLSQQMQALSLYGGAEPPPPYHLVPPPPPPSYTASIVSRQSPTQQDYRKSPSSGIYSGSGGSPSPVTVCGVVTNVGPAWSVARQAKSQPPVIMHSVKSTQVQKPVLQTATAPPSPPPPPPYKPSVPTTEPPSYASTMQALAAQRSDQSLLVTTVESSLAKLHHHPMHHPPPPQRKYSPVESEPPLIHPQGANTPPPPTSPAPKANGVSPAPGPSDPSTSKPASSHRGGKIDHQSPIPERKHVSKEKEEERRDCKVRIYSPQAFKFFMEQHVENVLKSHKQRIYRRLQLEKEMTKIGLSNEAQMQMRKMLSQKESNYIRLKRAKMDKSMFVKIKHIGVGAFGEVTLVRKIDTNHLYAMKTLRKADVLKRNQVAHVKAERDILAEADNEWVVKLYYSFQDKDNLYFVMDYIPGGDLMSLLIKLGIFEEHLARFYIAELTCAVESVHKMGFIHRDIKPDNILIDKDGHIKLTDFGLCTGFRWTHNSKYYQRNGEHCRQDSMEISEDWAGGECQCGMKPLERRRKHQRCLAHSLVGTPNYIAPEVLLRTGYTQLCDWWSVGVILYEMLVGSPPFLANTPAETQYKVIHWETTLQIPKAANVSKDAMDLILKLCTRAERRLGKNAQEVKQHPYFRSIDFERGVRKLTPPHVPRIKHSTDTSNFDPVDPDKLRNSSSDGSSQSDESGAAGKPPFHGFFEFTFRRFFDDGGATPYQTKITLDDNENQGAVYV